VAKMQDEQSTWRAIPWIGPAIVMIVVVVIWPAIGMIRSSFVKWSLAGSMKGSAGLDNYRELFANPDLRPVLMRTGLWVFSVVALTTIIALPLAQLLNARFPGRRLLRWAVLVPWASSVMMTATSFRWMLDTFSGIANRALGDLHLIAEDHDWLGEQTSAIAWMVYVAVFVSLPFTSFVLMAGLQAIPEDIIEAAKMDGAGQWRTYWSVKFPLLRASLLIGIVINLINVFNNFPIIWVMTQGGPGYETDTTTTLSYKLAFSDQNFGQSTAMATVNFGIVLLFILLFLKLSRGTEQNA